MRKIPLQTTLTVALLIAMEVVLSRFLSIATPIVKIGLGFAPLCMAAMLYGPAWGAAAGALADVLGALLFPVGPYFPGFTLTALLVGAVYGVFLQKEVTWRRVACAVLLVCVPLHLGLNTLWIHILYGKAFWALVPARAAQCLLMVPVQASLIAPMACWLRRVRRGRAS